MDLLATLAGALGTGGLVLWLGKREIERILKVVERVPDKEWFDEIREKVSSLPTNKRFEDHFAAVHSHANLLTTHGMQLDKLESTSADHEVRIRIVELKGDRR